MICHRPPENDEDQNPCKKKMADIEKRPQNFMSKSVIGDGGNKLIITIII